MTTDLERRLRDLADEAPAGLSATGLWDRGVRRHRARRVRAAVATALVLVGLVGGVQVALDQRDDGPRYARSPDGLEHLPRTIHEPAAWSKGTSEAGEIGPLAAIGSSDRKRATGIASMVAYEGLYGISAADGTVRFLDLPSGASTDMPGEGILAALSPDGRRVVFPRYDRSAQARGQGDRLVGWTVYDTVTGALLELDPGTEPSDEGMLATFSSDSQQVLVTYAEDRDNAARAGMLVAFDVTTGDRTVLEGPGVGEAASIGSGPLGIVWSRGRTTYTQSTITGRTTSVTTAHEVVEASYAPEGGAFAYVGAGEDTDAPWDLYVGPSPQNPVRVAGLEDPTRILGWRNANRVVVAATDRDFAVVDVNTGAVVEDGRFAGSVNLAAPNLAADLWANDLVDGVEPPVVPDQRLLVRFFWPGIAVVLLGLGAGYVLLRRRRG